MHVFCVELCVTQAELATNPQGRPKSTIFGSGFSLVRASIWVSREGWRSKDLVQELQLPLCSGFSAMNVFCGAPCLICVYKSILGDIRRWVGLRIEHLLSS